MKLLIVTSNDKRQSRIESIALKAGFQRADLVVAATEVAAMDLLHCCDFKIAVIDLYLNDSTHSKGLSVIRALKEQRPDCPVLTVSDDYSLSDAGVSAHLAGAVAYISTHWPNISWCELLAHTLRIHRRVIAAR